MQFNSYFFVLCFLPIVVCGYFVLNRLHYKLADILLILMSAYFMAAGGVDSLVFLGVSIVINYAIAYCLGKVGQDRWLLTVGIGINIVSLFLFKYYNFSILNLNTYLGTDFVLKDLILPIGISFYTFQQIAYLVDSYRGETKENTLLEYVLYIMFFPKLVMGPLAPQAELISQFRESERRSVNADNLVTGIQMFGIGLFKKVLVADTFAHAVAWGFVLVSYTFQIYFDFSGYSDMAIGSAKMLNIDLPMNFDSPYKALSIRDFWKRWHISLTKFLTKYIYIPLGGSRKGNIRTYVNTIIVFTISGLWHGANWTFVLWGLLHGVGQITERIISKPYDKLPSIIKWSITFLVVNLLWLLFRANSVTEWGMMLQRMFAFGDLSVSTGLLSEFVLTEFKAVFTVLHITSANTVMYAIPMMLIMILSLVGCVGLQNNYQSKKEANWFTIIITLVVMTWSILSFGNESVFVYYNF